MILSDEYRKWPQVPAALSFILDNRDKYLAGPPRDLYEFGVFRGGSLRKIENLLWHNAIPYNRIWGFDSFLGLPAESPDVPVFEKYKEGEYNATKLGLSRERLEYELGIIDHQGYLAPMSDKITLVEGFFDKLKLNQAMKPGLFVHIDCDLFLSTYQALNFLLHNHLIDEGTVIAFDEFGSTDNLFEGGESAAWYDMCENYEIHAEEVWQNTYFDKSTGQRIRQNVLMIHSLGSYCDWGIEC